MKTLFAFILLACLASQAFSMTCPRLATAGLIHGPSLSLANDSLRWEAALNGYTVPEPLRAEIPENVLQAEERLRTFALKLEGIFLDFELATERPRRKLEARKRFGEYLNGSFFELVVWNVNQKLVERLEAKMEPFHKRMEDRIIQLRGGIDGPIDDAEIVIAYVDQLISATREGSLQGSDPYSARARAHLHSSISSYHQNLKSYSEKARTFQNAMAWIRDVFIPARSHMRSPGN